MEIVGQFDLERFRVEVIHQELGREAWAEGSCQTPLAAGIVELNGGGWGHNPVHQYRFVRIDSVTYELNRSGCRWRGAVGNSVEELVGRFVFGPDLAEEDIIAALESVVRINQETSWD